MDLPLTSPDRRLAGAPRAPGVLVTAAEPSSPTTSAVAGLAAGTPIDTPLSAPAATRAVLRSHSDSSRPADVPRAPRTAFVLAGGARPGALQAGMLRALDERGIEPGMLVGTAAGALNAAYIASPPRTVQTANELARVWGGLHREDVSPIHPPTLIGGLANHRDHLVPDRALGQLISRQLQIARLEDPSVPLHLVAFDLLIGEEARLSEHPAREAVLAAASIPGVLPPVRWGQRLLVDGGVVNNTPISHAVELGAERVYVVPTGDPTSRRLPVAQRGALDVAGHASALLTDARLGADLALYTSDAELIVLLGANPGHTRPAEFNHADRLIGAAFRAARNVLAQTRALEPVAG
jgi:NTE family protein